MSIVRKPQTNLQLPGNQIFSIATLRHQDHSAFEYLCRTDALGKNLPDVELTCTIEVQSIIVCYNVSHREYFGKKKRKQICKKKMVKHLTGLLRSQTSSNPFISIHGSPQFLNFFEGLRKQIVHIKANASSTTSSNRYKHQRGREGKGPKA